MLLAGADLSMTNCNYSATALHYAVMRGDVSVVASMLEHMGMQADADLNATNKNGHTALLCTLYQMVRAHSDKTHQIPASVCIALIEAGHNIMYARSNT